MKPVSLATILLICFIPVFIAGRCSAPDKDETHQRTLDSLNRHIAETEILLQQSLETTFQLQGKANEAFQLGLEEGMKKAGTRIKYVKDTTRIISMSQLQRDSLIRAIYAHE